MNARELAAYRAKCDDIALARFKLAAAAAERGDNNTALSIHERALEESISWSRQLTAAATRPNAERSRAERLARSG